MLQVGRVRMNFELCGDFELKILRMRRFSSPFLDNQAVHRKSLGVVHIRSQLTDI